MSREQPETRDRILESTLRLLEGGGGKPVRMSDIARQAGISRQAVYLHFPTRAELLIAAARHVDSRNDIDSRLRASRAATTGQQRLDAFIDAFGNYLPAISRIGRALLALQDTDEAAAAAWNDRMQALREGCEAAVRALEHDGDLTAHHSLKSATDVLWTLLSLGNWELLTQSCGWSQHRYIEWLKRIARQELVAA